ncbi:MAG: hypothetical protein U9Q62_11635 [Campylobacterota bacterium]|nr:hypothetical protein [Campylobacterota bacterium]
MKRSTFDNIIGFLQGIFWAFLLIGAWITFHIVSIFGLPLAVFFTFLFIFFALIALLLLESMRINRLKADEVFKQTKLLESIEQSLNTES